MITEKKSFCKLDLSRPALRDLYFSLLLNEGKCICVTAVGTSMYPFVKDGDRIKIEPIKKEDIPKIGDIIAVYRKGTEGPLFLAHRLVKTIGEDGDNSYITKGDHSGMTFDVAVKRDLIAGKITEIRRGDLCLRLEHPVWKCLNPMIAKFSLRYPNLLNLLSGYISLMIDWKLLPDKIIRKWTVNRTKAC